MKTYLSTLNEREKWMLIGAGVLILLYSYYLVLYNPLKHQVTQKSMQLADKIDTLQWMKKINQKSHPKQAKKIVDNSQLLTALATQLKNESTLRVPYQLQQTSSGDIQITFDSVPFNLFMAWFEQINQHYSMSIKQFEADKTKTPGITRLMIVFSSS